MKNFPNLSQLIELSKDYIQVGVPIALAILAYRQKVIEENIKEVKKFLFDHILKTDTK